MRALGFVAAAALAGAALFAAACSGNDSQRALPSTMNPALVAVAPEKHDRKKATATFKVFIPGKAGRHGSGLEMRPNYISASTNVILIEAYPHGQSQYPMWTTTAVDPGSSNCTPVSGDGRVCTVVIQAPAGHDDIIFYAYYTYGGKGAPPAPGKHGRTLPSVTDYLSEADLVNVPILIDQYNPISATARGIVGAWGTPPPLVSMPWTSTQTMATLDLAGLSPRDAQNNVITAPTTAPYFMPVTAHVAGSPPTVNASLTLFYKGGGSTSGASVTIANDTSVDTGLALYVTGSPAPGYEATITYTAPVYTNVQATQPSPVPYVVTVAPMIVTSASTAWSSTAATLSFAGVPGSAPLSVSEAGPNAVTFTATPSLGCGPVATATVKTLTAHSATVTVKATGIGGAGGSCTITIADGGRTQLVVPVTVTSATIPIAIPTPAFKRHQAYARPDSIVTGPDGKLYYSSIDDTKLRSMTTTGQVYTFPSLPIVANNGVRLVTGADGKIWFAGWNSATGATTLGTFDPATAAVSILGKVFNGNPSNLAVGPDANVWLASVANGGLTRIAEAGFMTGFSTYTDSWEVVAGPTNLWVLRDGEVDQVSTAGALIKSNAGVPSGYYPSSMTMGPDNNLWLGDNAAKGILKMTPAGVFTAYPIKAWGQVLQIVAGPDGALWFVNGSHAGRITTSGATTDYAVGGGELVSLTAGPDGAIWLSDNQGYIWQGSL